MFNIYKTILKYFLYSYILSIYIYPALIRYVHFPKLPTLMFEILSIMVWGLYILMTAATAKSRKTYKFLNIYKIFFSFIILIIIISSVLNHDGWFLVFKSVIGYYFPYIIVFILVSDSGFSEKEQMNLLKFLFALIILQIPFTVFQYVHFHYPSADNNNGTIASQMFGGTGIISVLESFLIALAIAHLLFKGFSIKYFLLAILTFVPPIVGGAKFGFVSLPLAIIGTTASFAFLYKKVPIKKYINMFLFFAVFGVILLFMIVVVIPQTKYAKFLELDVLKNSSAVEQYDKGAGKSHSRLEAYGILLNDYFISNVDYAVGLGPGTITKSQSVDTQASISFIVGRPDTIMVMASLGFTGLLFFLLVFFLPIYFIKNFIEYEKNMIFQIFACAFIPITFITFIAMFYCPTWNSQIGLFYWIMLGVFVSRYKLYYDALKVINYSFKKSNINLIHTGEYTRNAK